jgi:hypothetical protein
MEKNEILNSHCDVRRNAAGNPNTPVDTLVKLSEDSDWAVRSSAAGNPNTPVDTLVKLSEDSDCDVRRNAAGNPNTPEYTSSNEEFIITETYVAIKGTNHLWYKHNYPNVAPFYTCGCFCGSREKLISRIYSIDNLFADPAVRMRILDSLGRKFKEVFGR